MATPKTPFRGRRTPSPPAVVGVVSTDSHEDGSVVPEPSPWKPPTPQLRPSSAIHQDTGHDGTSVTDTSAFLRNKNNQTANVDDEFRADNDISLTSLQVETTSSPPPSPYSPPAESLWSETTEDQFPVNHTKRQFPILPTPAETTPQMPPPRRRKGTPWPKSTPASSIRRGSDTTTPQTTATTPHQALFLLQEEHRLWQQDYHRLNAEWQATCDSLSSQVAVHEEALAALRAQLQESQSQCETLQQEKMHLEAELYKLKQSAEDLLNDKDEQVKMLEEAQHRLQTERDEVQAKNEQYEQEISRQSKRLLEAEEEVDRVTDESVRELRSVQQESLDRRQAWNVEKQSLQEEVRRLQEQVLEKDMELALRLEEERRTQAIQLRDLETEVSTLTNALAEYRGRHDELRARVDQHIQVGKDAVTVTRRVQTVACQTNEDGLDTGTLFEPTILPHGGASSNAVPRTPMVSCGHTQSSSPPLSHPGFPPTTPWTSNWTEQRQKSRTRADPPSSLDNLPARSFVTAATNTPLRTFHSLKVVDEKEELDDYFEEDRDEDDIHPSRASFTPQTEKATNVSRLTFKNRRQKLEKHEELKALVEEKVRSVLGDQATRAYLEKTIQDLRQQLDKKESSSVSSPTWQQETADLLAEIQRECNAAFRRGKARRKSPRNVVNHPSTTQNNACLQYLEENDEILKDFFFNENWGINDSTGDASIPLSLPALDESLNEIAESLNELVV